MSQPYTKQIKSLFAYCPIVSLLKSCSYFCQAFCINFATILMLWHKIAEKLQVSVAQSLDS